MKGLGGLMKQAQQMQQNMQEMQNELANLKVEGQSGGGLVSLIMTGKHKISKIKIDDSLIGEDKDMLEDLIAAAVNDASNKLEKTTKEKYSSLTGGLNIPGGFQMPF